MPQPTNRADPSRVELQLHDEATAREYRELGMFVRECVDRIERDTGRAEWWTVTIVPSPSSYGCDVIVQHDEVVVRATGNGFHATGAGWEAFRRVEDLLRTNRVKYGAEVTCGAR